MSLDVFADISFNLVVAVVSGFFGGGVIGPYVNNRMIAKSASEVRQRELVAYLRKWLAAIDLNSTSIEQNDPPGKPYHMFKDGIPEFILLATRARHDFPKSPTFFAAVRECYVTTEDIGKPSVIQRDIAIAKIKRVLTCVDITPAYTFN